MHRALASARVAALLIIAACVLPAQTAAHKTRNVIFVMTDGLRWQEVFRGAEAQLMNKENGAVAEPEALKKDYWRESAEERRRALMPFVWDFIAKNGQIFGNRGVESEAYVTNGLNFSYPGYSEALCGFPDPRVDSNDKVPNPNVTVLEWLNKKPAFQGKVAAFGAWDVFPSIINAERSGVPVNAGYDHLTTIPATPTLALLNRLKDEMPRVWEGEPFDAITFHSATEYLKAKNPSVLFLSLGETDEWAHAGNYAQYLHAANRVDRYVRELWESAQRMPEYRGTTTLIFATDHGRGDAPVEWKSHGEKVPAAKYVWLAVLGPDTAALGERKQIGAVTQNQIAATLAAFLGQDYHGEVSKTGAPIRDVLPK